MRISHREFIRISTLGVGGLALTACGIRPTPSDSPGAPMSAPTSALPTVIPTALAQYTQATKRQKGTQKGAKGQAAVAPDNPYFIATEILGWPTGSSVTADIVPAVATSLFYEYGTESGRYPSHTSPQSAPAGVPLETLIHNLQPNTRSAVLHF